MDIVPGRDAIPIPEDREKPRKVVRKTLLVGALSFDQAMGRSKHLRNGMDHAGSGHRGGAGPAPIVVFEEVMTPEGRILGRVGKGE